MADGERDERDSELESDTSSIDGTPGSRGSAAINIQHLQHRVESLQQENRVLRMELDTFKIRCKNLVEENKELRRASVNIQARAEQEEEYISNKLLKKIQDLKKEKETLAMNYEQEEEYLTNDLSRKLVQLRREKSELEQSLEKEQEYQINKLMKKIDKLEGETSVKQQTLDQLKREKVELENALEQEQESLVNRLWRRMDKLEAEKRILQERLDQPVSAPPSPRDINDINNGDTSANLTQHIVGLRGEVFRLRTMLRSSEQEHIQKMAQYYQEEKHIREENLRLQRRLQLETERREALCRNLSESESSLEMDDERHFNEMTKQHDKEHHNTGGAGRQRTVSSPIPYQSASSSRPLSPGFSAFSPSTASCVRCVTCGRDVPQYQHTSPSAFPASSPPVYTNMASIHKPKPRPSPDRFIKPVAPTEKGNKT